MDKSHRWEDFLGSSIDGWQHYFLGELFSNRQEKNRPELPLLAVTGSAGVIDRDKLERRDTSNADKSKYLRVATGDIIYNTMRMWQGVSGSAHKDGIVSPAYTVATPTNLLDKRFAKYLVKNELLIQKFHQNSQGLVDDTLNLKFPNFTSIQVQIPPLSEQKKIASILTSVDEVIENTQKQIDKLRDLKKATMNELLTKGIGHTEFKDSELGRIPKSWKTTFLGNLGEFAKGKGISKDDISNTGLPCIRYAEIYTDYNYVIKEFKSFISKSKISTTKRLKKNDIVFAGSGETVEDIGKSVAFLYECEAYVGGDAIVFSPIEGIDSTFLSYQLNDDIRRIQLRKLGQGSSIVHIYSSSLKHLRVCLPSLNEQRKIASVLTSLGKLIEDKHNKFLQTQSLKKALMQDLLTGKVRVKVD